MPNWTISGQGDDILIRVLDNHNVKELVDNQEMAPTEVSQDVK